MPNARRSDADAALRRRLTIVLPALNEEANIEAAVQHSTDVASRHCDDHEVIVVDDGSTDSTSAIVERMAATDPRIRLIKHRNPVPSPSPSPPPATTEAAS